MGYKVLGINLSHNGSVCVLDDGEIVFFLEEERLNRKKHDSYPIYLLDKISSQFNIDEIALAGLNDFIYYSYYKFIKFYLKKFFPKTPIRDYISQHHLTHSASSFYNSGFTKALSIVVDGNGSADIKNNEFYKYEIETIQITQYPINFKNLVKNYSTKGKDIGLTKTYESITKFLGWSWAESGKTMGLSSYGKENSNIPSLIVNQKGNPEFAFTTEINEGKFLPPKKSILSQIKNNPQLNTLKQDLAYRIQKDTQKAVGDLIEQGLKETGLKQVCCSGGYFLNCVANYSYLKRFPNVKFYFEPISSDAGTSIGAAKLAWYQKTQYKTIKPQKTLYYGPEYTKGQLLKGIQKYLD